MAQTTIHWTDAVQPGDVTDLYAVSEDTANNVDSAAAVAQSVLAAVQQTAAASSGFLPHVVSVVDTPVTAAKINAALAQLTNIGGGIVLLPNGEIDLEAPIAPATGKVYGNVILRGVGHRGILNTGYTGTLLKSSGNFPVISGYWSSSAILELGLSAGLHGSPAISANFDKSLLEGLDITGWKGEAVRLNDGTFSDSICYLNVMRRCSINDDNGEEGNGIYVGYRWTDSWIQGNNVGAPQADVVIETGSTFRFLDNHLDSNQHPVHNFVINGSAADVLIQGNVIEGCRKEAIIYYADSWNTDVRDCALNVNGNIFRSDVTDGTAPWIRLAGDGDVYNTPPKTGYRMTGFTVTGNTFRALGGATPPPHIISAKNADDIAVVGNSWAHGRVSAAAPAQFVGCTKYEVIGNHGDNAIVTS